MQVFSLKVYKFLLMGNSTHPLKMGGISCPLR